MAIKQACAIIGPYDSDDQFPVFGFGGIPKFMGETQVSHCFPLNGSRDDPSITGVDEIVNTYRTHLTDIQIGKKTLFAPVLEDFMQHVTKFD